MKIDLSRILYRLGVIDHKGEFLVILTWMLFFPDKESQFYFLGIAILLCPVLLRNIYFMKTFNFTFFSYSLAGFNFILILLTFFSNYHLKSILLLSDLFLISLYFILFYRDPRSEQKYFLLAAHIVSLFSLLNIIRLSVPLFNQEKPFFITTIHEGVLSGMGVLILLYYLLEKEKFAFKPWFLILILVNMAGVYVARSKAAFFGTVIFALVLICSFVFNRLEKKKRFLVLGMVGALAAAALMLTFVIPNPIKSAFNYSLKKDPYALNRIDIWKMSLTIFKDHPLTGVGLDNFSEVSGRYNFKQTRGPANYSKVPHLSHNDYLNLMTETGIFGLIVILMLFYFLAKKIFSSSLFNISKILILYLLAQAFFFNILFDGFFFFIFLFLLKNLLEGKSIFKSFSSRLKLCLSCLVIFVFTVGYLFPWLSDELIRKSGKAEHPVKKFSLLNKAQYLNPLDQNIFYLKARSFYNYFKKTSDLDAFYDAVNYLKQAQRLNKYFIDAYLLESDLYVELLRKNIYPSMDEEIIAPLKEAEVYAPVDPFIKLKKARIYFRFNKKEQAKEEALKAVTLEPEYVSALYFLQKNFNYFGNEETFAKKINRILEKAKKLKPEPGHYLYSLYKVPEERRQ
jgi:O-antigen ligase